MARCDRIAALERRLSRFDPGSELSELNQRGRLVVGDDLLAVVGLRAEAREATRRTLRPDRARRHRHSRYDRTFEEVPRRRVRPAGDERPLRRTVTIDADRSEVALAGSGSTWRIAGYVVEHVAESLGDTGPPR